MVITPLWLGAAGPASRYAAIALPLQASAVVVLQDFSNIGAVQQGMKSMAFASARLHPTEEEAVVNFHRARAGYMGTGWPVEV